MDQRYVTKHHDYGYGNDGNTSNACRDCSLPVNVTVKSNIKINIIVEVNGISDEMVDAGRKTYWLDVLVRTLVRTMPNKPIQDIRDVAPRD